MKATLVGLFVLFAVVSSSVIPDVQGESRFLYNCNSHCNHGGCWGEPGTPCSSYCYCYGSGYDYRCYNCDL